MTARPPRVDWGELSPTELVREVRLFTFEHRRYMRRHMRANIGAYLLVVATATFGAWANDRTRGTAASDNARAIRQIQAERVRSIIASCEQTNERNQRTKRKIHRRIPAGPGRGLTLELVDALAPVVSDCRALAVRRAPSTPGR